VFEEIAVNVKSRIKEINDAAQTMTPEDIENQLADDYYYYSETFSAINNNIYLAHVVSAVEIHLNRLKSIYTTKHPSCRPPGLSGTSFMRKFEGFMSDIGCSFDFAVSDWQDIDAFRAIRNGFIHGGAEYSDVEPVGQLYIDNNPSYFDVKTILRRNGTTQKTTFYIKNDIMLLNAISIVKRITDKITTSLKTFDI
jgi:hypothetical protein